MVTVLAAAHDRQNDSGHFPFDRPISLVLWAALFPFLSAYRKKNVIQGGIWKENVIIIGAGKAGIDTAKGIAAERHLGYNIIGFLDDDDEKIGTELCNRRAGNTRYSARQKISASSSPC